jgi:glycogen debranching enzyme
VTNEWNFRGESVALTRPANAMLVEGSSFCISEGSGDISESPDGLFFIDTRVLSMFRVRVNSQALESLVVSSNEPFHATFVSRTRPIPDVADSRLLMMRNRYVGGGMREDISVRNLADQPVRFTLEIEVASDFARLFTVKEGRAEQDDYIRPALRHDAIQFHHARGRVDRSMRVEFDPPPTSIEGREAGSAVAHFETELDARATWNLCVQFTPSLGELAITPTYPCGSPSEQSAPARRLASWRRVAPEVTTDFGSFATMVQRGMEDLGALGIVDHDHPDRLLVAAGAPWFMTVFGRDSLLTALMSLMISPDLAAGVLRTLAQFQGRNVNDVTEEQPGRILHELRFEDAASLSLADSNVYYGSADATPLFVVLLGELQRWGLAADVIDELLPNADRALDWIDAFGDRDGDGYVEYQRATERGLINQGWKDSWDGVRFADGTLPHAPIAMAEIQGYVFAAYLSRSALAATAGDDATAQHWRAKATQLKDAFNRDFWLPDRGWFAMGLDRDKRPIDALASNMGQCLWTGIVDDDKAAAVAELLLAPEMFSGWGVRTLATSMRGYNPVSYHCGSVWPHDNALIAAGLMRYGFVEAAHKIIVALIDAATVQGGRLPELFSGLDRAEFSGVVSYPASCVPQAWAAASPFSLMRTLLRFNPELNRDELHFQPALPDGMHSLIVKGMLLGDSRVTLEATSRGVHVRGLPSAVRRTA